MNYLKLFEGFNKSLKESNESEDRELLEIKEVFGDIVDEFGIEERDFIDEPIEYNDANAGLYYCIKKDNDSYKINILPIEVRLNSLGYNVSYNQDEDSILDELGIDNLIIIEITKK